MADEPAPESKVAAEDPQAEESILKRRKKKKKDEKKEMTPSEELVSTLESQCVGYLSLWRAASLGDLKAVQRAISLNHYSAHTRDVASASVSVPSSSAAPSGAATSSKRMSGVLSSNRRGSALSEDDFLPGRAGQAAQPSASGAGSLAPSSIDDAPAECGATPLVAAVSGDHLPVVQFLLSVRADPGKACPVLTGGATPLIAASKSADSVRCLEALLDAGASVDTPDAAGNTPLMYAARSGNLRAAEMLLTRGANPSAANKKGMTAAMFASLFARIAVLELLHQRESESPTGGAPADAGSTAGAALLNTADARGNTALHHAALCGHGKVARTLVRALGAHATARNLGGKTPADVAVDKATFNAIIGRE